MSAYHVFIHACSACRKEVGYDGWRLDFVRGFWGGYVKDYLEASEPYFAVGEYWDSLSYTYGEMDYNQDAHRQRIVDWINATNGTAGAFDVTTKGILHAVRLHLTVFKYKCYMAVFMGRVQSVLKSCVPWLGVSTLQFCFNVPLASN
jgi:hypothetical protein